MEKKALQLVAVVERNTEGTKKNFWTRIGVAFENTDGSHTLRFDYVPARMADTTIQLRPFEPKPKESREAGAVAHATRSVPSPRNKARLSGNAHDAPKRSLVPRFYGMEG